MASKREAVEEALYDAMMKELEIDRPSAADRMAVVTKIAQAYATVVNADPAAK
jgi:hypothetical protein